MRCADNAGGTGNVLNAARGEFIVYAGSTDPRSRESTGTQARGLSVNPSSRAIER